MKKLNVSWMSNPQYLAQVGHFFGPSFVLVQIGIFAGTTALWICLGIGIALAIFKEFVFDTASWGEGDSWTDSAMDFAFYMLGGAAAMVCYYLAVHYGHIR
jgi:hypothetical protein